MAKIWLNFQLSSINLSSLYTDTFYSSVPNSRTYQFSNQFFWNFVQNLNILLQKNVFEIFICKKSAILFWPHCIKEYVLNEIFIHVCQISMDHSNETCLHSWQAGIISTFPVPSMSVSCILTFAPFLSPYRSYLSDQFLFIFECTILQEPAPSGKRETTVTVSTVLQILFL